MYDDGRGVGESLNETNDNGVGIQVNTRYFLQLLDRTYRNSSQRQVQLVIDEPLQYFVAQDQSPTGGEHVSYYEAQTIDETPSVDFDGDLKIHLLPLAKNSILLRLENLSDLFDEVPVSESWFHSAMHWFEASPEPKNTQFDL